MEKNLKSLTKLFGDSIRSRRNQLGISQEALAERVDISQKAISRMEQGRMAPKFERLSLFADALECNVVDFFIKPEDNAKTTSCCLEECMESLNTKQRAFVLNHIAQLTEFLAHDNSENLHPPSS